MSKESQGVAADGFWAASDIEKPSTEKSKAKRTPFRFGGKKKAEEDDDASDLGASRILNKAIAFTGIAGAGATGTIANLARAAARRGLRVALLDLDTDFRGMNLYFNKFCTLAEESEEICRSLIMSLANPNNYMTTAVSITDNLWVIGLGYDFMDRQSMDNLFTEQKAAALVSALKSKFDYVFVDITFGTLSRFPGIMMHFDTFALCVENNLHGAVTTLRALINDFSPENIQYLNLKSKLVATKYNSESVYDDEIMTPERLSELMTSGMCDDFVSEVPVAGAVPYAFDFDRQIESDVPIYQTNSLLMQAYDEILARL
jgi:septum formation inhibitor-activating ATPase MinD